MFYKAKNMFDGAGKALFEKASQLRKQQTFAEELLCKFLNKTTWFKFRKQHVYGIYILDFYCHKLKLIIEVDGSIYDKEEVKQDNEIRQSILK